MKKELSLEQNQIIRVLSSSLFNTSFVKLENVNYDILLNIANIQSVFLQVFSFVKNQLSEEQKKRYSKLFFEYVMNNTRVEEEHIILNNKLTQNKIDCVLFKGCASAAYYKYSNLRVLGDVDFWINDNDVENVKMLFDFSFTCTNEGGENHISFSKENISGKEVYELHTIVKGIPKNEIGNILRNYFTDIIEQRKSLELSNGTIYVPSDFHHGLILLIHMSHHMMNEGIGLRHLCDWAVFANSFSNEQFIELYKEKLEVVGLWRFTQIITMVCSKYLGMPEKEWSIIDEDNIDELLNNIIIDIFESGNFGFNDVDRYRHIKYMSVDNNSSKASKLSQSLFQKTEREHPVVKTKKYLYPIYATVVGFEYLFRVVKKERRIDNMNKVLEGASKRKEIYEKFRLFEIM